MFDWIKHIRIQNKERHLIISVKVSTDTTLHVQLTELYQSHMQMI